MTVTLAQIISALKSWRKAADQYGVDSAQAHQAGAIAMPLLFENRELLPQSEQRFQLRGYKCSFELDEIKTMNDGGACGFYADQDFIADLEKSLNGSQKKRLPVGDIAQKVYNILNALPETKGLTASQISEKLAAEHKIILDDSTLRKNHLKQLEKYGLKSTQHGYCIR
ncbi:MAG: helix-turn-helix transcriptional regulator [Sedimentisphaerales bacterium]|nr:helix-turn-helix transcriptional regulator [Sedimentisphaerales bacterium]